MTGDRKAVAWALVAGILLGGGLVWSFGPRPWWARRGPERMVRRLSSKLDLSAEQRKRLEAIIESKRGRLEALRTEMHPRFEEIRESTRAEIRGILDERQRAKFEKIEERWKKLRDKGGRGPGERRRGG